MGAACTACWRRTPAPYLASPMLPPASLLHDLQGRIAGHRFWLHLLHLYLQNTNKGPQAGRGKRASNDATTATVVPSLATRMSSSISLACRRRVGTTSGRGTPCSSFRVWWGSAPGLVLPKQCSGLEARTGALVAPSGCGNRQGALSALRIGQAAPARGRCCDSCAWPLSLFASQVPSCRQLQCKASGSAGMSAHLKQAFQVQADVWSRRHWRRIENRAPVPNPGETKAKFYKREPSDSPLSCTSGQATDLRESYEPPIAWQSGRVAADYTQKAFALHFGGYTWKGGACAPQLRPSPFAGILVHLWFSSAPPQPQHSAPRTANTRRSQQVGLGRLGAVQLALRAV